MTKDKLNELIKKVNNEESTPEEELELLKFLNKGVDELRTFVKNIIKAKEVTDLKNTILEK